MKALAEVVAISTDPPSESRKLDQLLAKAFPVLSDPNLKVISAYQMRHLMGGETVGNMGYAIIDGKGRLVEAKVDPLFGRNADIILDTLKELQ